MITDLNKILIEWAYRTKSGKPNPKSMAHQIILEGVLKDFGWDSEERNELLSSPSFLIETDIVKNKKSGNTYVVQKHNPDTQSLVKKDASKDDIKKVEKDKNGEEPEEKKAAQLNGYIGDKDKSVSEGDPSESEEYQKDHEPDDEEFESKNEKHKNPEPPPPLSLDGVIENPKFPKRYIKMLERMANSRLTTKTKKWEHFSDIPGGAGQIKAQAGELMTMIGSSLDDKEFDSSKIKSSTVLFFYPKEIGRASCRERV